MKINEEKQLLLKGIKKLQSQLNNPQTSLEYLEHYITLVNCLIQLNWQECGQRKKDYVKGQ